MSSDPNYNPFQSPLTPQQANLAPAWGIVPFESGHARAMAAIVLLGITALLQIVTALSAAIEYSSLLPNADGSYSLTRSAMTIAEAMRTMSWADTIVFIGTVVAFCMWTHRAARNLPALGARGLHYTPAWAVGWFFIPVANLAMPYFVGAEIWRESDPAQRRLDGYGGKTGSPLVIGWWLTYILSSVVPMVVSGAMMFQVGYNAAKNQITAEEIQRQITHSLPLLLQMAMVAHTVALLASILAIIYVWRVDANQQASFDQASNRGPATLGA